MALLDRRDADHRACATLLLEADEPRIVPAPVLVELDYFVPVEAFTGLLADVRRSAFLIADLAAGDLVRIEELLTDYADLRVGFVDAAVLAIVERLGEQKLATLDRRHFSVMRPSHCEALELLPEL